MILLIEENSEILSTMACIFKSIQTTNDAHTSNGHSYIDWKPYPTLF